MIPEARRAPQVVTPDGQLILAHPLAGLRWQPTAARAIIAAAAEAPALGRTHKI